MATIDELKKFYVDVMNCPNYQPTKKACPEITRDKGINPVPRGFYFSQSEIELPIKILAVAKNPGHAKDNEPQHYKGKKGSPLVEAHLGFVRQLFSERKNPFQKNLLWDLREILDLPEDKVWSKAAYTNLIKCSTKNTQEKLSHYPIAANTCFEKFFIREARLFKPQVILALGREAEGFLRKHNERSTPALGVPNRCISYMYHPSYRKASREQMDKAREKLKNISNF